MVCVLRNNLNIFKYGLTVKISSWKYIIKIVLLLLSSIFYFHTSQSQKCPTFRSLIHLEHRLISAVACTTEWNHRVAQWTHMVHWTHVAQRPKIRSLLFNSDLSIKACLMDPFHNVRLTMFIVQLLPALGSTYSQ